MRRYGNPIEESTNRPLVCLYRFAELVDKYDKEEMSLDLTLKGLVRILPDALRFPELGGASVLINPITFASPGYVPTSWRFETVIDVFGEPVGSFEVSYGREVQEAFNGPFTADEVMLFTYVAGRISRIIERLRTRKQLGLERKSLKDANIALNEVLKRFQEGESEIGRTIQTNINKVVLPMLNSMFLTTGRHEQKLLKVVIGNLSEIASPFTSRLSSEFMALTPQELVICNLIKDGMSSKEIAMAKGLSFTTVNTHRENIRKKLKLNNKKINLRSYLANNFT